MLARGLTEKCLRSASSRGLRVSNLDRMHNFPDEDAKPKRAERKLKKWEPDLERSDTFLAMFQREVKKGEPFKRLMPQFVFSPTELKQWYDSKKLEYVKEGQRFILQRHRTLGCDLAAAHLLIHLGGRVKFAERPDWYEKKEGYMKLPMKFNPYWQLSHIDASGITLYYEGLCNFINLGRVEWASFKGSPYFDVWSMDKIISNCPLIEYLDVSECDRLNEKGVGACCRLQNLRELVVTDRKTASFELTCMMLEDDNPNLRITIKEPKELTAK